MKSEKTEKKFAAKNPAPVLGTNELLRHRRLRKKIRGRPLRVTVWVKVFGGAVRKVLTRTVLN